jgi:tight adherence protein C
VTVLLFSALVVAAVGVLVWSLQGVRLELPGRSRQVVRQNLGPVASGAPDLRRIVLEQSFWRRVVRPSAGSFLGLARRVTPAGVVEALDRRRRVAGADARWTIEQVLAAKVLLGATGILLGLAFFVSSPTTMTFVGALLLAGCGYFGVDVLLEGRARERVKAIEHEFPNALDQITICVEAGLGLDAAIAQAARSGHGPLADELSRVLQDVQVGVGRQTALEGLAERTNVSDVKHFVVAVGQAQRYGVPVVQALRAQALEARERRRSRAEERAQKMSVTMLFPLIFCILPSLFVVLLGPAAIRIANMGFGGN